MKLRRSQLAALALAALVIAGVVAARLWHSSTPSNNYRCGESPASSGSVQIPAFSVSVSLSDAAAKSLQSIEEGVAVYAVFDGDGVSEPGENTAPHRDVFLCHTKRQLVSGVSQVTFSGLSVPTSRIARLSHPDYHVNVNASSARLSHPDNLLECEFHDKSISSVARNTINLRCSLLTESSRY